MKQNFLLILGLISIILGIIFGFLPLIQGWIMILIGVLSVIIHFVKKVTKKNDELKKEYDFSKLKFRGQGLYSKKIKK